MYKHRGYAGLLVRIVHTDLLYIFTKSSSAVKQFQRVTLEITQLNFTKLKVQKDTKRQLGQLY